MSLWTMDLFLAALEVLLSALILSAYLKLWRTQVGKILVTMALVFLLQGVVMIVAFTMWSVHYREYVALPSMAIALSGVVGLSLLYYITKM